MEFKNDYLRMLEPKTDVGKEIKAKYDGNIKALMESHFAFPSSGNNSREENIKQQIRMFNSIIVNFEDFTQEEISEAYRPQMMGVATEAGYHLRLRYHKMIEAIENSEKPFPLSGPGSKFELVNDLRIKFNTLAKELE